MRIEEKIRALGLRAKGLGCNLTPTPNPGSNCTRSAIRGQIAPAVLLFIAPNGSH